MRGGDGAAPAGRWYRACRLAGRTAHGDRHRSGRRGAAAAGDGGHRRARFGDAADVVPADSPLCSSWPPDDGSGTRGSGEKPSVAAPPHPCRTTPPRRHGEALTTEPKPVVTRKSVAVPVLVDGCGTIKKKKK